MQTDPLTRAFKAGIENVAGTAFSTASIEVPGN
jgi:hypothetical protein